MVKIPPCKQYEPPENIEYFRKGKKFCRVSTQKGNKKQPQYPPCQQYGDNYTLYIKNNKQFCRKSLKKHKKKKCQDHTKKILTKFGKILNIDLSKYKDKTWICESMKSLLDVSDPELDDIKYLSKLMKIRTRKMSGRELCTKISNKILTENKDFLEIVNIIKGDRELKDYELHNLVSNILLFALYPYGFPHHSPLQISEELYQELIKKKVSDNLFDTDEEELLTNSLYIKLCHCIKKMLLKNKFMKDILEKPEDINPYPICINSIYNNRGIKLPKNATKKCKENFNWVRNLDYIKKQQGGNNQNIGPSPPNKEIIKNNNITSCFNSFIKEPVLKWPNRFACPSKKCNNWAGGKKTQKKGGKLKCNLTNKEFNNMANKLLQKSAQPSLAGKYNQLQYASKIAQNFDNTENQMNWKSWMKNHDNFWW